MYFFSGNSIISRPEELNVMINPNRLTDEQVIELRNEKIELNRKSRRQTGMKLACTGKSRGLLECETLEGRCPDYDICHAD